MPSRVPSDFPRNVETRQFVTLYDCGHSADKARQLFGSVLDGLKAKVHLSHSLWAWTLLKEPLFFEKILSSIRDSDLFILAFSGDEALPQSVANVLKAALERSTRRPGGILYLATKQEPCGFSHRIGSYLQILAQSSGVAYFNNPQLLCDPSGAITSKSFRREALQPRVPAFDELYWADWGINE